MAILTTYYLNGPTLGSSTTIFLNSSLSIVAPNGFYSDGVTSREQVAGVLLPPVTCEICPPDPTYNCISGECIDPGDGTGTYASLFECESACSVGPYTFSMLNFGTDTNLEACADWIEGDPPNLRTNRYSTGFTLSPGDILYTDIGLTTPFTWPVIQYYGYGQPIPSGGLFNKWCKVDTDGTVLEVGYCS